MYLAPAIQRHAECVAKTRADHAPTSIPFYASWGTPISPTQPFRPTVRSVLYILNGCEWQPFWMARVTGSRSVGGRNGSRDRGRIPRALSDHYPAAAQQLYIET